MDLKTALDDHVRGFDNASTVAPKRVKFTMLEHQEKLVLSDAFAAAVVGGIGSGKSHALGMCVFHWINTESNWSPIIALAPTYEQLDKATLARIKAMLIEADIDFVHGSRPPANWEVPLSGQFRKWTNVITLKTGHLIVCASLDEPSSIRGPQYGMALIDELAFCPSIEAFDVVIGRLRCKYAKKHKIRVATSPNGMNWFYHMFANPKKKRKGYTMIPATSMDNPYNPASYYEELAKYDDDKYQQEVLGHFVSVGSERVYTEFDVKRHIKDWEYVPDMELHVGMDFNRSPLCWVISQKTSDGVFHVFDQIFIESEATTVAAKEQLIEKYPNHVIYAYPDASCRFANTAATGAQSDMEILIREEFSGQRLHVSAPCKNPPVVERIEALQAMLRNDRLFISPNCEECIESMSNTAYKPGTRMQKKSKSGKLTGEHFADAVGYMAYMCQSGGGITEIPWT